DRVVAGRTSEAGVAGQGIETDAGAERCEAGSVDVAGVDLRAALDLDADVVAGQVAVLDHRLAGIDENAGRVDAGVDARPLVEHRGLCSLDPHADRAAGNRGARAQLDAHRVMVRVQRIVFDIDASA